MTTQFSNGNGTSEPLNTPLSNGHGTQGQLNAQFSNGHIILEPRQNKYTFARPPHRRNRFLFYHVLKHVVTGNNNEWNGQKELWDDLESFSQEELQNILSMGSVQQIINNHTRNNIWIDDDLTTPECQTLHDIPQFTKLAERYREMLSKILGECNNHVNPECQIFNPHCHFLYKVEDSDNFAQVIAIMDAPSGILTAAIAPYRFNPNSSANFENCNIFVIKTGYRLWRSRSAERRTKKFKRSVKELNRKIIKLSAIRTDIKYNRKAYRNSIDNKNHFPEYINKKITNSTNTGTTNTGTTNTGTTNTGK